MEPVLLFLEVDLVVRGVGEGVLGAVVVVGVFLPLLMPGGLVLGTLGAGAFLPFGSFGAVAFLPLPLPVALLPLLASLSVVSPEVVGTVAGFLLAFLLPEAAAVFGASFLPLFPEVVFAVLTPELGFTFAMAFGVFFGEGLRLRLALGFFLRSFMMRSCCRYSIGFVLRGTGFMMAVLREQWIFWCGGCSYNGNVYV